MHRRDFIKTIVLAVPVAIGGCAQPETRPPAPLTAEARAEAQKQKAIALRSEAEMLSRVQAIGDRLSFGAAPLCGNLTSRLGWGVVNRFSFEPDTRDVAISEFALGDMFKIYRVTPDGPAARAGVMTGDEIATIDGVALTGSGAGRRLDEIVQAAGKQGRPMRVDILRKGRPVSLDLAGLPACDYPVFLLAGEKINAATDGTRILVSEGLVRFARDDTELALVLAHEMSHDIRNHVEAQRQNATVGAAVGALLDILAALGGVYGGTFSGAGRSIGAGAYSNEFEAEADYVSLYVMALSGFDITHAPDSWRRMATVNPDDIDKGYTHPSSAERFVALEAAVQEIQKKQAEGKILRPETK